MLNQERANTAARERQNMYDDAARNSRYTGNSGSGSGGSVYSGNGPSTKAELVGLIGQTLNNFQARRNERALERQRAVEAYELKMQKVHEDEARMTAKIMGTDRPLIEKNLEKAAKGDARAMADAGFQYLFGIEVAVDKARGLSMIEDAANHGDARSMHNLAFWYRNGNDGLVTPDLARSNAWLRKAAEAGDVEAMVALGSFLQAGNGIAVNFVEALRWDTAAAQRGNAIAAENAAVMLTGGYDGITPDPDRAEAYYRQAIAAGSTSAGDNLLVLLSNLERTEDHTETLTKAFKLRLELAQSGDPVHEAMVGVYYLRGYVGSVDIPKAIEWFNRAVEHGSARACYELALLYDQGAPGVAIDQDKALSYYRRAAVQGFPEAVYVMGYRIFEGMGIQQDEIEGERLLRLAAESGHSGAPRIIAQIYTDGLGVEPNREEAIKWLRIGVERHDEESIKLLEAALSKSPADADVAASASATPETKTVARTPPPASPAANKPGSLSVAETPQVQVDSVKGYDDAVKEIRQRILGLKLRSHSRGDGAYTMLSALYNQQKASNPALTEHAYVLALHDKAAAGSKEDGYLFGAARLCGFGIRSGPDKEVAGFIGAMLASMKPEVLRDYGVLLIHGKGVPQDEKKGFNLIKQAADAGLASAQALEGELLFFGVGAEKDQSAGIALWQKAAEAGDDWGGYNFAHASKKEHPEISMKYFKRGAEAGDDRSMFYYGWFLEEGMGGIEPDLETGTAWIERAATAGNPRAQGMMGAKYAEGRGVPEDATVACFYWEIAARHGDAAAQLNLGLRLINGDGVGENRSAGIDWLKKAAAQGSTEATEQLQSLGETG
jgi:TPR repeat protein